MSAMATTDVATAAAQEVQRIFVRNTVDEASAYLTSVVTRSIDESRTTLRSLIGSSHADLVALCDRVVDMGKQCSDVSRLLPPPLAAAAATSTHAQPSSSSSTHIDNDDDDDTQQQVRDEQLLQQRLEQQMVRIECLLDADDVVEAAHAIVAARRAQTRLRHGSAMRAPTHALAQPPQQRRQQHVTTAQAHDARSAAAAATTLAAYESRLLRTLRRRLCADAAHAAQCALATIARYEHAQAQQQQPLQQHHGDNDNATHAALARDAAAVTMQQSAGAAVARRVAQCAAALCALRPRAQRLWRVCFAQPWPHNAATHTQQQQTLSHRSSDGDSNTDAAAAAIAADDDTTLCGVSIADARAALLRAAAALAQELTAATTTTTVSRMLLLLTLSGVYAQTSEQHTTNDDDGDDDDDNAAALPSYLTLQLHTRSNSNAKTTTTTRRVVRRSCVALHSAFVVYFALQQLLDGAVHTTRQQQHDTTATAAAATHDAAEQHKSGDNNNNNSDTQQQQQVRSMQYCTRVLSDDRVTLHDVLVRVDAAASAAARRTRRRGHDGDGAVSSQDADDAHAAAATTTTTTVVTTTATATPRHTRAALTDYLLRACSIVPELHMDDDNSNNDNNDHNNDNCKKNVNSNNDRSSVVVDVAVIADARRRVFAPLLHALLRERCGDALLLVYMTRLLRLHDNNEDDNGDDDIAAAAAAASRAWRVDATAAATAALTRVVSCAVARMTRRQSRLVEQMVRACTQTRNDDDNDNDNDDNDRGVTRTHTAAAASPLRRMQRLCAQLCRQRRECAYARDCGGDDGDDDAALLDCHRLLSRVWRRDDDGDGDGGIADVDNDNGDADNDVDAPHVCATATLPSRWLADDDNDDSDDEKAMTQQKRHADMRALCAALSQLERVVQCVHATGATQMHTQAAAMTTHHNSNTTTTAASSPCVCHFVGRYFAHAMQQLDAAVTRVQPYNTTAADDSTKTYSSTPLQHGDNGDNDNDADADRREVRCVLTMHELAALVCAHARAWRRVRGHTRCPAACDVGEQTVTALASSSPPHVLLRRCYAPWRVYVCACYRRALRVHVYTPLLTRLAHDAAAWVYADPPTTTTTSLSSPSSSATTATRAQLRAWYVAAHADHLRSLATATTTTTTAATTATSNAAITATHASLAPSLTYPCMPSRGVVRVLTAVQEQLLRLRVLSPQRSISSSSDGSNSDSSDDDDDEWPCAYMNAQAMCDVYAALLHETCVALRDDVVPLLHRTAVATTAATTTATTTATDTIHKSTATDAAAPPLTLASIDELWQQLYYDVCFVQRVWALASATTITTTTTAHDAHDECVVASRAQAHAAAAQLLQSLAAHAGDAVVCGVVLPAIARSVVSDVDASTLALGLLHTSSSSSSSRPARAAGDTTTAAAAATVASNMQRTTDVDGHNVTGAAAVAVAVQPPPSLRTRAGDVPRFTLLPLLQTPLEPLLLTTTTRNNNNHYHTTLTAAAAGNGGWQHSSGVDRNGSTRTQPYSALPKTTTTATSLRDNDNDGGHATGAAVPSLWSSTQRNLSALWRTQR